MSKVIYYARAIQIIYNSSPVPLMYSNCNHGIATEISFMLLGSPYGSWILQKKNILQESLSQALSQAISSNSFRTSHTIKM